MPTGNKTQFLPDHLNTRVFTWHTKAATQIKRAEADSHKTHQQFRDGNTLYKKLYKILG